MSIRSFLMKRILPGFVVIIICIFVLTGCPTPVSDTPLNTGKWVASQDTDPLTDATRVLLMLDDNSNDYTLIIRTNGTVMDAYVYWGYYLASFSSIGVSTAKSVTVRFGSDAAITETWNLSTNSTSTFAPDSALFISKLLSSDTFVASIYVSGVGTVTTTFDTRGLAAAAAPYKSNLPWLP